MLNCMMWSGVSEVRKGTIVILAHSQEKVILAADSRLTAAGMEPHDTACKLISLGDGMLFTSVGLDGWEAGSLGPTDEGLNVAVEASAAFDEVSGTATRDEVHMGDLVADRWAQRVATKISPFKVAFHEYLMRRQTHQMLAFGVFADVAPNGQPTAVISRVLLIPDPRYGVRIDINIQIPSNEKQLEFHAFGPREIFNEFHVERSTERARNEWEFWTRRSMGLPIEDRDALLAVRLVELTIEHSDSPDVGGEVDAAELTADRRIRWIQRKASCKE